jgi:hypothetical protein
LVAFLAVVILAIFRRAVRDERGLEYAYKLFKIRLTRNQFYDITKNIVRYTFWGVVIIVCK